MLVLALGLQLGIGIGFRRNHSWLSTFMPRRNHSLCLCVGVGLDAFCLKFFCHVESVVNKLFVYCCFRLVCMQYLKSHYINDATKLSIFCGNIHRRFIYDCFYVKFCPVVCGRVFEKVILC